MDLANAYGSPRHNLIQFALKWYHIPRHIREIVFSYYDNLHAVVVLAGTTSRSFPQAKGVFQGCTLSTILFNTVFNLLFDYLQPTLDRVGYRFVDDETLVLSSTGYADDVSVITASPEENQIVLNRVDHFLNWTETIHANPANCFSLARKQVADPKASLQGLTYSTYNPKLKIANVEMKLVLESPFKFLGRNIPHDLNRNVSREAILSKFQGLLTKTDEVPLSGTMKLWIYEFVICSKLSWDLMVYDTPDYFNQSLESLANRYLKKWTGLARPASTSIFYRTKSHFGLHLKQVSCMTKKLQVVKMHLLKYSTDPNIRAIYALKLARDKALGSGKWTATVELEKAERAVELDRMAARGQSSRQGLGLNTLPPRSTAKDHRQAAILFLESEFERERLVEDSKLEMQADWMKWQHLMNHDLSWKKILYHQGENLLKFLLNATTNTCATQDNLRRWSITSVGNCKLCHKRQATLLHVLNSCPISIAQPRYLWRHDSLLQEIYYTVRTHVNLLAALTKQGKPLRTFPALSESFVKAGQAPGRPRSKRIELLNILGRSGDWKIQFDLNYGSDYSKVRSRFPAEIAASPLCPDGVVWSSLA
ncbi:MAG: reverse transcriptase domain-containing protein, partial [Bacteroidota bacterium]